MFLYHVTLLVRDSYCTRHTHALYICVEVLTKVRTIELSWQVGLGRSGRGGGPASGRWCEDSFYVKRPAATDSSSIVDWHHFTKMKPCMVNSAFTFVYIICALH